MIQPTKGRVLVEMLPVTDDFVNSHGLVLVDKKKHFDHSSRRGKVTAVGRNVRGVAAGDVVIFRGDAGFTLDGDPEVQRVEYGEGFRWLKESDLMAVDETPTQDSRRTQG